MSTHAAPYERLLTISREAGLLGSVEGLLGWDQETMMPPGGGVHRARQLALLARLRHERLAAPEVGELLAECEQTMDLTADTIEAANVRLLRHDHDRAVRLPASLVEEIAATASTAQHAWAEARAESDFPRFRPWLEKTVDLCRQKAACYGWAEGGEPWDALAEDYEPGCTAAAVAEVFGPLRTRLRGLLEEISGGPARPSGQLDEIELPESAQMAFSREIAAAIGFDFSRGRLDTSTHPFCGGSHCDDVRLTTRFHPAMVTDAMSSTMHEAGHGMYEQGLQYEHAGTPCGESASLGIHESQSRMWENQVGRSAAFWRWAAPRLKAHFGSAVDGIDAHAAYESANRVAPGLIRVEADEATYNMHVMIRFALERDLLTGELPVADLPHAWNSMYRDELGVEVPDDRRGCLQDIHWSMGALGYFPTYTLGNLYSAQLFEAACDATPGLVEGFAAGTFSPLLAWLREQIHRHGRRYSPADLCARATGRPLSADPLLRHLEAKFRPLYGI
jgi:carboxypeptidase Taq